MTVDLIEQIIEEARERGVYEKSLCLERNLNPRLFRYYKSKYGLSAKKGSHLNSKKKREYHINDNFFSDINELNSYWAGFIAADGSINEHKSILSIVLSRKDISILEKFLKCTGSNYPIRTFIDKEGYEGCSIQVSSKKLCQDLGINFNITPKKTHTLKAPNLSDIKFVDAFIVGYIDGDGSIGLYKTKKNHYLKLTVVGTNSICNYINNRMKEILNNNNSTSTYKIGGNGLNGFTYSDKQARILFEHFYKINVPKLERKWSKEKLEHCKSFKKYENLDNYKNILRLSQSGKKVKDISSELGISVAMVYWYKSRDTYKVIAGESKQLEQGIENES